MKNKFFAILTSLLVSFSLVVPVFAKENEMGYSLLEDYADLLTDEEESELLSELDSIQSELNMDVVVVTIDSLEGKTATEYADDFFDYNGYGQNESHDGILFLISMQERKWAISTTGRGITYFTDAGQEYMTERFMSDISDGYYFDGFMKYAKLSRDFIVQGQSGEPYDVGNMPKHFNWVLSGVEIVLCFVAAAVYCVHEKSKLITIRESGSANAYILPGSVNLRVNDDRFINKLVTCRVIPKSSDSSGGGSSTHTSSSGTSHGGSSGSF